MYENNMPVDRYNRTLQFLQKNITTEESILDLGVENPFGEIMKKNGYKVSNTKGEDLDLENDLGHYGTFDVVSGFEILEHLVNPLTLLTNLEAKKLIVTIPLRLWFAPAYRSKTDPWDRHYHEFEDWQFDWLLEKAGWNIKDKVKWVSKSKKIGLRPFLRNRTPRYYGVYAER